MPGAAGRGEPGQVDGDVDAVLARELRDLARRSAARTSTNRSTAAARAVASDRRNRGRARWRSSRTSPGRAVRARRRSGGRRGARGSPATRSATRMRSRAWVRARSAAARPAADSDARPRARPRVRCRRGATTGVASTDERRRDARSRRASPSASVATWRSRPPHSHIRMRVCSQSPNANGAVRVERAARDRSSRAPRREPPQVAQHGCRG